MDRVRAPRAHSSSYTIMLCALTKSSSPAAHDHFFMAGGGGERRRGIFDIGYLSQLLKGKPISQLNLGKDSGGGSL